MEQMGYPSVSSGMKMMCKLFSVCVLIFTFGTSAGASVSPKSATYEVSLNGVTPWYKVAGRQQSGEAPVLFLHGGPGYNTYSFEKTAGAQLESHMQMIYLDQRGSGRSQRPANRDYSMSTLVADVEALRVHLGVPKVTVMGHTEICSRFSYISCSLKLNARTQGPLPNFPAGQEASRKCSVRSEAAQTRVHPRTWLVTQPTRHSLIGPFIRSTSEIYKPRERSARSGKLELGVIV